MPDRLGKPRRETILAQILEKQALRLREANRKLEVLHATTEILAECETWLEAGPRILRSIGIALNWETAYLWAVDEGSGSVSLLTSWSREFPPPNDTASMTYELNVARQVCATGESVWIEDIGRIVCAFPLKESQKIFGAMTLFTGAKTANSAEVIEILSYISTRIDNFARGKRTERALRESADQLARLRAALGHSFAPAELQSEELQKTHHR